MKTVQLDSKVEYFTTNTHDAIRMLPAVDREVKFLKDTAEAFYAHENMPKEREEFRDIYIESVERLRLFKSLGFYPSIPYRVDDTIYVD